MLIWQVMLSQSSIPYWSKVATHTSVRMVEQVLWLMSHSLYLCATGCRSNGVVNGWANMMWAQCVSNTNRKKYRLCLESELWISKTHVHNLCRETTDEVSPRGGPFQHRKETARLLGQNLKFSGPWPTINIWSLCYWWWWGLYKK